MGHKITELYAWVTLDESDGDEGVPAATIFIGGVPHLIPLIGSDVKRIESLAPKLHEIGTVFPPGTRFLRRFAFAEETDSYTVPTP